MIGTIVEGSDQIVGSGDDVTDFDAFRALRGKGISVFVSETAEATCADYRLRDTEDVRTFLGELTAIADGIES